MSITEKSTWLKLIHVAQRQLNMDDDAYRALLEGAANVSSSKELENSKQFEAVMQAFKNLGFKYQGQEIILPNRASKAQINYIKKLWDMGSRIKTDVALRHFLQRITGVDDVRFLTKQQASAIILALQDINKKNQIAGKKNDGDR